MSSLTGMNSGKDLSVFPSGKMIEMFLNKSEDFLPCPLYNFVGQGLEESLESSPDELIVEHVFD